MNYKSNTAYAWGIFIGILLAGLAIDYSLRITSDDFRYSGIPETIWFLLHVVAATIGGYFILCGTKYLKNTPYKIIHVTVNFMVGIMIYTLTIFLYIVGLGIDSV